MILIDATTKSLEVVLSGAVTTNQLVWTAHYVDLTSNALNAVSSTDGATNNTTAVTAVAAPSASHQRQLKYLSVYNADTVAATVTVRLNDNATTRVIVKTTLQTGETLEYTSE